MFSEIAMTERMSWWSLKYEPLNIKWKYAEVGQCEKQNRCQELRKKNNFWGKEKKSLLTVTFFFF